MKKQIQALRRPLTLAVLGGAMLAPLLASATSSQAAPPAWNKRNNRPNQNQTVFATVLRDLSGRDRFTVRLDNGRTAEVISRRNEPLRLSSGDRVELRGDFERDLFIADSVRVVRNEGPGAGNGQRSVLVGRVSRDYYGRDFEIRTDNGRSVTVRAQRSEPIRLSSGDRVEVGGRYDRGLFLARDVHILRNNNSNNGSAKVDFYGNVIRRENANRLIVRGADGRTYTVITKFTLGGYTRNDRVRVIGFSSGAIISASTIDMVRDR